MQTTPDLGIPELAQAQANPDISHNEAIVLIQAVINGAIDKDLTAPPGAPTEGDTYIINTATPTGAWAGHARAIAIFWSGSWRFIPGFDDAGTPIVMGARQEGLAIWVRDEDVRYTWTGAAWSSLSGLPASAIAFTPYDDNSATNVQAAVQQTMDKRVKKVGDEMTGLLKINLSGQTVPTLPNNPTLQLVGVNSGQMRLGLYSFGSSSGLEFYSSGGTAAAKTAIASLAFLGFMGGGGFDGTNYGANRTFISMQAGENWTPTAQGASIRFATTALGTASAVVNWIMGPSGSLYAASLADPATLGQISAVAYLEGGTLLTAKYARLAAANVFTSAQEIAVAAFPSFFLNSTGNAADTKAWQHYINGGGSYIIAAVNDARSTSSNAFAFTRTAATVTGVFFPNGGVTSGPTGSFGTGTIVATSGLRAGIFTVGTLPAASIGGGFRAWVTDATLAYAGGNIGTAVTGGGANLAPVYSDGINWRIG